jgi:carbonic anhydrase
MEIHRQGSHYRPYPAPRKNVLLLSCMDLRLIDDIVRFMEADNLSNRYDQLVFAGAAFGVIQQTHKSWRDAFFDHLDIAVELHDIHDVYIMEHRNCGAYAKILGSEGEFDDSPEGQEREEIVHRKYAFQLRDEIRKRCEKKRAGTRDKEKKSLWNLNVHCFLMDLRGGVIWLKDDGGEVEF